MKRLTLLLAWVLWRSVTLVVGNDWDEPRWILEEVFSTEEKCKSKEQEHIATLRTQADKHRDLGSIVFETSRGYDLSSFRGWPVSSSGPVGSRRGLFRSP